MDSESYVQFVKAITDLDLAAGPSGEAVYKKFWPSIREVLDSVSYSRHVEQLPKLEYDMWLAVLSELRKQPRTGDEAGDTAREVAFEVLKKHLNAPDAGSYEQWKKELEDEAYESIASPEYDQLSKSIKNAKKALNASLGDLGRDASLFEQTQHEFVPRQLEILIDPGDAPAELIAEFYTALDVLYQSCGGSGLKITKQDRRCLVGEEVL